MQASVRRRGNFGQGRAKKASECPKSRQLRTRKDQKSKRVSEDEATSDKEGPNKQASVRRRGNFGQGRAKKAIEYPKSRQLRTRKDQKRKRVSEVEATSDKEGPNMQEHVPSRANFGQGRAKKAIEYPKSRQLRTRKDQKRKRVSEVEATSDKEVPNMQEHVPSRANFGQGRAKKASECPKSS
ncbi:hypothetical protein [Bacillus sp. X1(2014)]|uniref:hypothetical protein n=1 Tax=Bacillus sp. X1(2014) TaxID=1565991 RepID=UPI0011A326E0|nr:hypothetical protein [Bacillus sp. X1(2014)]